jgi:hypothetical protein
MTVRTRWIVASIGASVVVVTAAHALLNVDRAALLNVRLPAGERKLHVAFIPVT